uniref:Uncharacterized protein n=1 Tax=Cannabis sativa TaxID=3483 RepID=A0A803R848_CANSA
MFSPYLQLLRVSNLCIYKYSYSLLRFLQNCVDFICVCVTSLDIVGRLIKNSNQGTSMVHEYLKAPHQIMKVDNNNIEIGEEFIEGRMDFEKSDYSGVGANPEHDPKPPSGNV